MFKYTILLSILAFGSAQAWDGKLIKFKHPRNGLVYGHMVRYYDEQQLSSKNKLEAMLAAEGFKFERGGDYSPIPGGWYRTSGGIKYVIDENNPYCNHKSDEQDSTEDSEDEEDDEDVESPTDDISWSPYPGTELEEAEIYADTKAWIENDDEGMGFFLGNFIIVELVCKKHNAPAKTFYEKLSRVGKRLQQEYPGFTYEIIDYVDGKPIPATAHLDQPTQLAPIHRFTNFLREERMPLGLMALSLLTLAVSSR